MTWDGLTTTIDVDAFIGGVQVGIAAILVVLALVGGLAVFRRIIGA